MLASFSEVQCCCLAAKQQCCCLSDSFATPWTTACQASLSMGFTKQEYWNGLPFPSPGDLPNPGIKPGSPALLANSLPSEPPVKLCTSQQESPGTDPSLSALRRHQPFHHFDLRLLSKILLVFTYIKIQHMVCI